MARWTLSPVFVYECVLSARRWQTYAGRIVFLAALLVSLIVVWFIRIPNHGGFNRNALAAVGESFYHAIAGTQLVLVLLAAPAYTAASICLDKARGTLAHMLVTDLSAADIVVGKLAARGLPVFGFLLAGVPVMVLATLLGGIEPEAIVTSFLVTLAVALVCCSVAIAFSVWGKRPHEVLLATYFFEAVWLLAGPLWEELRANGMVGVAPVGLRMTNPFALLFATGVSPTDFAVFIGICVGVSAVVILFAVLTLRMAARREGSPRKARFQLPRLIFFGPSLDYNPVLWREWRRRVPSRWLQFIWGLYVFFSLASSILSLHDSARPGQLFAFVNAFQFSIGLLLVSVTSVASLFDERVSGSLDVLLATPLSTESIVWGKWLAGFRLVVLLMVLPVLVGVLVQKGPDREVHFMLLICLMLAYGAMVNSLGLAMATWIPRFGVAMGVTVAAYALLAAGPILLLLAVHSQEMRGFASLSPWYGVGEATAFLSHPGPEENWGWKIFWVIAYSIAAFVLAQLTRVSFNRCLGRAGG